MTINLSKTNLLNLEGFIKSIKPLSIGCAGLAIAGLAIHPLINNKSVEVAGEQVEEKATTLPPANYTIVATNQDEIVIRFHNQKSELHLKNIDNEQYNCLLSGGGINCVLAPAYQPKLEVVETENKPTPQTEIKKQSFKLPEIEISSDMADTIMVAGGVGLFFLVWSLWKNK